MNSTHYYTNNRDLPSKIRTIKYTYNKHELTLLSDNGVFSNDRVDFGTNVLLNALEFPNENFKLLDLGCGYGIIGIAVAKAFPNAQILMSDVNDRAIELTNSNIVKNNVKASSKISYLFDNIAEMFDMIVTNPPIRAGKAVVHGMIEQGYSHLNPNGEFWAVIQKKQGAESFIKKMKELFTEVITVDKINGYYILRGIKS